MRKFIYCIAILLILSISFTNISCSNDNEEIDETDTFDYELLDETLTEPAVKFYDNGKEHILAQIEMNDWHKELSIRAEDKDIELLINWTQDEQISITEPDTFNIPWVNYCTMDNKSLNLIHHVDKKGIMLIRKYIFKPAKDSKHMDSVSIEGAFNIQDKKRKIKGVFKYDGKLDSMVGA